MPKRFTATEKWDDPWYRKMTSDQKHLWNFICDRCDITGVWKVDLEMASFYIGADIIGQDHLEAFNRGKERVTVLNDGGYWLINDFINFQWGILKPECSAHRGVIKVIHSHSQKKGLPKGYLTLKDKDKEKEQVKDKEYIINKDCKLCRGTGTIISGTGKATKCWGCGG